VRDGEFNSSYWGNVMKIRDRVLICVPALHKGADGEFVRIREMHETYCLVDPEEWDTKLGPCMVKILYQDMKVV